MSLGVLNNLSAVYAENNLNNTNNSLTTVLQQLSSGSKINSGADDAAGLSLVNGLQANQTALTQSETNATEGVGLLQVADGALSQVTSLLNRAVTLATEASNGTLNSTQDTAANQEYQSILSEISNIGSTTTYNQMSVFGSNTNIYTGDSSQSGSSVDDLNIRSLSATNVGDTGGVMSYSNGQNNVFLDLSSNGKNAAVTDTLGTTTQMTTVAVNYLTTGSNGAVVQASANISVGAGTNYANTAQGLINAINNSGLGVTATFGTAAQAGAGATSTAISANDTTNSLATNSSDTGIIISGTGIGVNNTTSTAGYSNGAGEIGTVTVAGTQDTLSGTLNIVGANGVNHTLTLGTTNSTDTLANLASTINGAGWGVTANLNSTSTTNSTGTHTAGTVMTLYSASSATSVTGANMADSTLASAVSTSSFKTATGTSTLAAGPTLAATIGTINVATATDTLTGVLSVTEDAAAGNVNPILLGHAGTTDTLTDLAAYINGGAAGFTGINAALSNNNTTLTLFAVSHTNNYPSLAVAASSQVQDVSATSTSTATPVVAQTATGAAAGAFGTVTASNASDTLSGTLTIAGTALTLGTSGSTDNLYNLMNTINGNAAIHTTAGVTASVNSAGTILTLTGANATIADNQVYGTNVATSLSLTGTPTAAGTAAATTLGTLYLPSGGASGDTLGGTLAIGTDSITLGTAATSSTPGTATLTELAQTINAGNYGVNATLNQAGTAMTLTSPDSNNITLSAPSGGTDTITTTHPLVWEAGNQGTISSSYYDIGISVSSSGNTASAYGAVADTSTTANTTAALTKGIAADSNGKNGVATVFYSDAAGQSLSATDLVSANSAQSALTDLNTAIADVAAQDGYVGAQINTLNAVSSVLSTQQENVQSAQNAVQATDYASATSNMSKYEILSQTGIAALAQANSMQQEVTKLLQ